jgi:hypothetical protein
MLLPLLLRDGIAQGVPSTAAISDLLCVPHLSSDQSTRALWQQPPDISGSEAGEKLARNGCQFCRQRISFILHRDL